MPTIVLSGNLRRFADFNGEVTIDATTVADSFGQLYEKFPELQKVLVDGDGNPRRAHRVFLNDEILDADGYGQSVDARDTIVVITAVAGG